MTYYCYYCNAAMVNNTRFYCTHCPESRRGGAMNRIYAALEHKGITDEPPERTSPTDYSPFFVDPDLQLDEGL